MYDHASVKHARSSPRHPGKSTASASTRPQHQQLQTMKPVLVVGAGPVGLTAANSLARFGIPVKIIDSRPCPTLLSKALVIWRRSMQTLDPLIHHEDWSTEHCRPVSGVDMADGGAIFASVNLKDPEGSAAAPRQHQLPAGLLCTQAGIEAGLEKHLKDTYGITVERSTQLDSFTVDETSGEVRCMLSTTVATPAQHADLAAPAEAPITSSSSSNQREVVVSYLIGCDGARSAVRKGLGIPFPGYSDAENRFLMVDCTYEHQPGINSHAPQTDREGKPALDRLLANTTPVGIMASFPLVDKPGTIRMIWNAGRDGPAQPTLDDFQSLVLNHSRLQIKLKDVLWQSAFSINERVVESYVHNGGRVLLAGDAAHVHSPAGGQGMNTGIQDATNLAWKVALAVSGDVASAEKLLQTYHEERHPQGEAAIRFSGGLLRANAIRSPVARFVRRVALGIVTRIPPIRQGFISILAEDTVSYTNSSLAKAAPGSAPAAKCAGTAFPDVSISINGGMRSASDLLRGGKGSFGTLVLLTSASEGGVGEEGSSSGGADVSWPTHWVHWPLHVVSVGRQGQQVDGVGGKLAAVDEWGLLANSVGGASGVLVRPDGIIAAAGGPECVAGWLKAHGMTGK